MEPEELIAKMIKDVQENNIYSENFKMNHKVMMNMIRKITDIEKCEKRIDVKVLKSFDNDGINENLLAYLFMLESEINTLRIAFVNLSKSIFMEKLQQEIKLDLNNETSH